MIAETALCFALCVAEPTADKRRDYNDELARIDLGIAAREVRIWRAALESATGDRKDSLWVRVLQAVTVCRHLQARVTVFEDHCQQ